jgi:hypothetical protein
MPPRVRGAPISAFAHPFDFILKENKFVGHHRAAQGGNMTKKNSAASQHASVASALTYGNTIVERLDGLPKQLKAPANAYKAAHEQFSAAQETATQAEEARNRALSAVNEADKALDTNVLNLANALVAAGLGSRIRPFAEFSSYAPSKLIGLAYTTEIDEVIKLLKNVAKKNPPATLKNVCTSCSKAAANVKAALGKLTGPETAYKKALAKRDAAFAEAQKQLSKFRKAADYELDDDPQAFKELFAKPARVQQTHRQRARAAPAKRKPAPSAPGAASSTTNSDAPPPDAAPATPKPEQS